MENNNLKLLIEAEDLSLDELQSLLNIHFADLKISTLPPPQKVGRSAINEILLVAGSMTVNVASSFVYDFIVKLKESRSGFFGKVPYAIIETSEFIRVEFRKEVSDKILKRWINLCLKNGGIQKVTIANETTY